jgi:tetratricopeptide (TPR) repeat protein
MPTPPIPNFHGRTAELAQLRHLFEECAARDPVTGRFGGPRMAVVIAESGIGKSRLVQALYQQLTTDLLWDPPEVNYWPDAFMDAGVQLRVTPNMSGHVAQGPPRFAWLGARFHSTDIRNLSERRSSLTELRHSIMTHAEILRAHGSAWADATGRIKHAIARDSVGETISQVADAAVPFGGLLAKLVAGGVKLVRDRTAERKSVEDASDKASKTLVDDVAESMCSLLDGKGGLPSILWLDDSQWIDAETQELLYRVWRIARERDWPLLVVITHWERPWRELRRQADGERGLVSFEGQPGVSIIELQYAEPDALRSYLLLQMPGLTPDQQSLMLEKAAGNFLTMVENVGQLLRVPANFVERRTTGALCPAGERVVREWQSERHKHVEQNFTGLAPEVQELLGWSSHLGMSFLHEVVEDFADQVAGHPRAAALLQECVDPLVILGRPNDLLREFRDRAFHDVAKHYFANYGQEHAAPLEAILRKRLAEWVNNSFDETGDEIWPHVKKGISAPPRAITGLSNEEARDVLGMAVAYLPLQGTADWSDSAQVAALRARYLLAIVDRRENLWDRVRQSCQGLEPVDWNQLPMGALAIHNLEWLADQAETAGALLAALGMRMRLLAVDREAAGSAMPDRLRDVSVSLINVGRILECRGDLSGALARYEESLVIAHRLLADEETPDRLRDVSVSLNNVGNILERRGDMPGALARYEECLVIAYRLLADEETPDRLRDVSFSLINVGRILECRGDISGALARYEESLGIARRLLADEETPERLRDVSVSLDNVGRILEFSGDIPGALARYEESLGIRHRLLDDEKTPERWHDVSVSLNNVGNILRSRGDTSGALERYEASLVILRQFLADEETPDRLRDVSVSLNNVGDVLKSRGDMPGALARYEESLGIAYRLLAFEETPDRLRDVYLCLDNVGRILKSRGDMPGALARHEESLVIAYRLLTEEETPGALNNLVWSAQMCAGIEISLCHPDAALVRLESFVEQATILESATDANTLDTAATYWERHTEAFDALGRSADAAISRSRALANRARIAEMGSD